MLSGMQLLELIALDDIYDNFVKELDDLSYLGDLCE